VLNRPALLKVPKFALQLAAGEVGGLILNSQRAVPEKLLANGFAFRYPELEPALRASIQPK
jgi:NAD dependent epimerase/dehydratase family enzyme